LLAWWSTAAGLTLPARSRSAHVADLPGGTIKPSVVTTWSLTPQLQKPLCSPLENSILFYKDLNGRGSWIRTNDLQYPKLRATLSLNIRRLRGVVKTKKNNAFGFSSFPFV
jgi:hypothetical protein